MIKKFKHKGLEKFHKTGSTAGIQSAHKSKLGYQLDALDTAVVIDDMDMPGWGLHPLKGQQKGRWSIEVSGNWRLTFEFENGDAYVVDYEDYH
jgi:proteic killer suppression protein